jgi:hypothetical protein
VNGGTIIIKLKEEMKINPHVQLAYAINEVLVTLKGGDTINFSLSLRTDIPIPSPLPPIEATEPARPALLPARQAILTKASNAAAATQATSNQMTATGTKQNASNESQKEKICRVGINS